MGRRTRNHGPNRAPTLNQIADRADNDAQKQSREKVQEKLDRVIEKIENKDPSDPGYHRLMRRAERLENAL
jgi:hypothetical protein